MHARAAAACNSSEQRESGIVYKCPREQHDDLGMSLAMLAWAG
jgi:hypothetical protein